MNVDLQVTYIGHVMSAFIYLSIYQYSITPESTLLSRFYGFSGWFILSPAVQVSSCKMPIEHRCPLPASTVAFWFSQGLHGSIELPSAAPAPHTHSTDVVVSSSPVRESER